MARAARGIDEEVRRGVTVPLGHGFAGAVAARREPLAVEDVDSADVLSPLLRERGIRSLLGVPLLVEGRLIGVLHVGTLTPRRFTEGDMQLLQLAADRVALAIARARVEEDRRLAVGLQRALLAADGPLLPMPGVRIGSRYRPAARAARVGGDWYDVFRLPDGGIGLGIGDVVGRGVTAAALMGQVRNALRAYALEGHPPVAVADRLNDLLRQVAAGRTATLSYFALDPEDGSGTLVSAAHLPPLLLEAGGAARYLETRNGPPLGATARGGYEETPVALPLGAILLLYTDGLVERRDEEIGSGLDRLRTTVTRLRGASPEVLCDGVLTAMTANGDTDDDVALVAAALTPLGRHIELELPARPEALASLRRQLERWLNEMGAAPDVAYDLTLACSEAAANAVEHAYAPGAGSFRVTGDCSKGAVTVTVRDEGRWRPERDAGRGRGMMLVRALVDDAEVTAHPDGGTTVVLRKSVSGARA